MTEATSLSDARIRRARWHPGARTFELQLDAAAGVRVLLRYRNVGMLEPALPELAKLVEDVAVRVAGEVCEGTTHSLRLAPAGRIVVRCGAVERIETLSTGVDYEQTGFRFDILSC